LRVRGGTRATGLLLRAVLCGAGVRARGRRGGVLWCVVGV
jgi:hypothetical protein